MKKIFFICAILFCSCVSAQTVYSVKAKDFKIVLDTQLNAQLIDVRTQKEYNKGHLKNSVLIDYFKKEFKNKLLKLDKNKPILVYCAVGGRSGRTTKILKKLGFKTIYDLEGGYKSWKKNGYPIIQ